MCVQGLGLYAARDIEKCTMVIEYIGAIIRSEVANRKERLYESQVQHTHTDGCLFPQTSEPGPHLGSTTESVQFPVLPKPRLLQQL